MKFDDSGLLNDPLVQKAFDYAQAYTQGLERETIKGIEMMVESDYREDIDMLEEDLEYGDIDEEDYKLEKAALEQEHDENLKSLTPENMASSLQKLFYDNCLTPALEIQQYSENNSPALIAAALLVYCVRDPIDFQKVEKAFGSAIAGLTAELAHVDAYPGEHDENVAAASTDAKRLMLAEMTGSWKLTCAMIAKLEPEERAVLSPEEAKDMFNNLKLLWGNDKKLDARLVDIFNQTTDIMGSPFHLDVGPQGKPELTRSEKKGPSSTPAVPNTVKKPPSLGDDGF